MLIKGLTLLVNEGEVDCSIIVKIKTGKSFRTACELAVIGQTYRLRSYRGTADDLVGAIVMDLLQVFFMCSDE